MITRLGRTAPSVGTCSFDHGPLSAGWLSTTRLLVADDKHALTAHRSHEVLIPEDLDSLLRGPVADLVSLLKGPDAGDGPVGLEFATADLLAEEISELDVQRHVAEKVREHVQLHDTTNGYLFTGKRSAFVSDSAFRVQWWKARAAAGMPELRYHDLRHAYASYLLGAGVPITDVSRWIGHRQIEITFSVYSHFVPKSFDRARDLLDAEWS